MWTISVATVPSHTKHVMTKQAEKEIDTGDFRTKLRISGEISVLNDGYVIMEDLDAKKLSPYNLLFRGTQLSSDVATVQGLQ